MTVKSPNPAYSSYKIYYPTTWSIKEYQNTSAKIDSGTSLLTLSKGPATITLIQNQASGTLCTYSNDSIEAGQYREFIKDSLVWRSSASPANPAYYEVCQKTVDGEFTNSVETGAIYADGLADQSVVDEFHYILERITVLP